MIWTGATFWVFASLASNGLYKVRYIWQLDALKMPWSCVIRSVYIYPFLLLLCSFDEQLAFFIFTKLKLIFEFELSLFNFLTKLCIHNLFIIRYHSIWVIKPAFTKNCFIIIEFDFTIAMCICVCVCVLVLLSRCRTEWALSVNVSEESH